MARYNDALIKRARDVAHLNLSNRACSAYVCCGGGTWRHEKLAGGVVAGDGRNKEWRDRQWPSHYRSPQ